MWKKCELHKHTAVSPYRQVIRSKTYRGYMKPWIILNDTHAFIIHKHGKFIDKLRTVRHYHH
jgi:hypothetical protein